MDSTCKNRQREQVQFQPQRPGPASASEQSYLVHRNEFIYGTDQIYPLHKSGTRVKASRSAIDLGRSVNIHKKKDGDKARQRDGQNLTRVIFRSLQVHAKKKRTYHRIYNYSVSGNLLGSATTVRLVAMANQCQKRRKYNYHHFGDCGGAEDKTEQGPHLQEPCRDGHEPGVLHLKPPGVTHCQAEDPNANRHHRSSVDHLVNGVRALNENVASLIDFLLGTQIEKFVPATDPGFVQLKGSQVVVPAHYFEPAWTARDWKQLVLRLLDLLPPGSAHAFVTARRHHSNAFGQLYKQVGSYASCPPVVQEAMFFERRDVQVILEQALAVFYTLFTPEQFEELVNILVNSPWQLAVKSKLYNMVKRVVVSAEITCTPGKAIQFWNDTGVAVLPSEMYVIFCILLFEQDQGLINTAKLPFTGNGILQRAIRTVWQQFHRTQTLQAKSPSSTLSSFGQSSTTE